MSKAKDFINKHGAPLFVICVGLPVLMIAIIQSCAFPSFQEKAASLSILNPGFEGEFRNFNGIGELTVAEGWFPWWDESGARHRPEWKAESTSVGSGRVHSGTKAQKQFTTFSPQYAGIYQVVDAVPGEWYEFSCWVYIWSSDENNPDQSIKQGKLAAMVGINPWGDRNVTYRTTVWGQETESWHSEGYDRWLEVSVVAPAFGQNITLVTAGEASWGVKHNDSYWDDCALESLGKLPDDIPCPSPSCPTPECPATPAPQPCPTCVPGTSSCPDLDQIRTVIEQELQQREPVQWPR